MAAAQVVASATRRSASGDIMIPYKRKAVGFHGVHVRYAEGWQDKLAAIGIAEDQDWTCLSPGTRVKRSPITECYRVTLESGETVFFKRYVYTILKPQFYYPLPSKAAVESFGYAALGQLGIPTLEVLAIGEKRRYGDIRAAFIVTREVPDCLDMEYFARHEWYNMPEAQYQQVYRELEEQILQQVATAHRHHFCHHDLKWRNVLVHKNDDHYKTVWIDCPRAEFMPLRRRRNAIVDLGGLARLALSYLSPWQQMRFLRRYVKLAAYPGSPRQLFMAVQQYLERRPPQRLRLPSRGQ